VLFEAFKGISRDRLFSLGEEYCERILVGHLFPRAVELIEANRAAGIEPVLVTGSPDFIVAPLARHLGIADFAANRFVFSRGRATGRLAEPVMAGDEKSVWCADYAAGRNIDLADCWGYADSHYDTAFLAALGHPVAVNPDRRLRAAALSRQWPVIHFEKAASSEQGDDFDDGRDLQHDIERSTRGSDRRIIPYGEEFIFEKLPVGTRVIYPPPPLEPLPDADQAIRYAPLHPED